MVVKARKSEEQVPIDWVIYLDVGLRPAAMIDGLTVMAQTSSPETGLAVADAEFTGIGRDDDQAIDGTSVARPERRCARLEARINAHGIHCVTE
jgi:hypothetical protein